MFLGCHDLCNKLLLGWFAMLLQRDTLSLLYFHPRIRSGIPKGIFSAPFWVMKGGNTTYKYNEYPTSDISFYLPLLASDHLAKLYVARE